jgi:diguanylate cyclase (GGDEF)-like protein
VVAPPEDSLPTRAPRRSLPGQHRPFTDPGFEAIPQTVSGSPQYTSRAGAFNNAELVVWQSSRRLIIAIAVGAIGILLQVVGVVDGPSWPFLVIVPAYVAIVTMVTAAVERQRHLSSALVTLALADVGAVFVLIALVAPPAFYSRALLLSLLAMQLMQMFSGRTPALTVIVASTLGYSTLVLWAWERGVSVAWVQEGWLLAIYLLVAMNGMALQSSANRRLAALVELFAGAQRGDFSHTFVDERGREPDGITLLGRSYNHLRSELATMVFTDSLTGCLNRRGFDQVLEQAVASAVRRNGELALLAIDIDHFKSINDSVGHLAGDAILRELSDLLLDVARGAEVARVGGEEFVILLPNADGEMAGVMAERVLAKVRGHIFRTASGGQQVTVSIGIAAEQVGDAHAASALRARSDEALYLAKRLGRNRVVFWAPGIRSNSTPPWVGVVSQR